MDGPAYEEFTKLLSERLASDPEVLGLVALGSMSGTPPLPDRWSDHDFFVITKPGEQERFRAAPGWLPAPDRIVLWHRETAHGLKAVWDDGHLAEFAVFDPDELALARVNRWSLLFDHANLRRRLEAVQAATASAREAIDARFEVGQLLSLLLVGGLRAARGERLSGGQFVRAHAARHFLRLMEATVPAAPEAVRDDLDPFRRVELSWPVQAGALDAALALAPLEAARALLELADETFRALSVIPWPAAPVEAVRRALRNASGPRP
jgi:hypothetical protein